MIKVNDTVIFEGCKSKVLVVGNDFLHINWNDEYIEVKKDEVKTLKKFNIGREDRYPQGYLPKIQYYLNEMNKAFSSYMEHEEPVGNRGLYWKKYITYKSKHDYFLDKQI